MEEKSFFKHNDVEVTESKLKSGNQTYPVSNITSYRTVKQDVSSEHRKVASILLLIGGFGILFAYHAASIMFGILSVVVMLFAGYKAWKIGTVYNYKLLVTTSSGESCAVESLESAVVARIEKSLDSAIFALNKNHH